MRPVSLLLCGNRLGFKPDDVGAQFVDLRLQGVKLAGILGTGHPTLLGRGGRQHERQECHSLDRLACNDPVRDGA